MKGWLISWAWIAMIAGGGAAYGNDGGVYAVQPFGAKFDKQAQSFTFTGQYAQELKKILPPSFSVLTSMEPKLTNAYNKNFRGILMKDPAGNALNIECNSADIQYIPENKHLIKEKPEATCTVTWLEKIGADEVPTQKLQVQEALQKAQEANRLK
ncbi:MAG: hypothetical protein IT573_09985 [Deltaproteobacteria bacterium]|nr:hypothetical protein [Deltaproteobacteria bacterium]